MVIYGDVGGVNDARSFALARARKLGVFTSAPTVFEDPFTDKVGNNASKWRTALTGTGAVSVLTSASGGVCRLDTGATASSLVVSSLGTGTDIPGVIPDTGPAGARWYMFWVFRVPTTVDNKAGGYIEITKSAAGATNSIYFGVDGQFVSTTKFMIEDNSTSATSTISIDTNWHYAEVWQTGTARVINFAFDGEPALSYASTADLGGPGVPRLVSSNGTTAASRQLDTDHFVMLMPGNVTLPNT